MDWTDFVGIAAGVFTTIAVVPQIKKAWDLKKVEHVSLGMFSILMLGVALWVVYGIAKKDLPIIATNAISLMLNGVMLYLMVRYRKKGD